MSDSQPTPVQGFIPVGGRLFLFSVKAKKATTEIPFRSAV
jgi:hypothetical protein